MLQFAQLRAQKHDKRTALTAAVGFPTFINSLHHLDPSDGQSRSLILPDLPSLPRLLLMQFTTTLLPIIPRIDDYTCALCTDVAFKPILLRCGHRFCVRCVHASVSRFTPMAIAHRCLVKMQKRAQDACPNCRRPVVCEANACALTSVTPLARS
jgi:hypothetical protein